MNLEIIGLNKETSKQHR